VFFSHRPDAGMVLSLLLAFVSVATGLIALADCAKAMQSWRDAIDEYVAAKDDSRVGIRAG
jgi:hypothetical protein